MLVCNILQVHSFDTIISGLLLLPLVLYLSNFFLSFSYFFLLLILPSVGLNGFLFLSSLSLSFSCPVSGCCCLITQTLKLKTSKGETIYNHCCLDILSVRHCIFPFYLALCLHLRRDGGCASRGDVTTWFSHIATD